MDYPFWQQAIPLTMIFIVFFVVVIRPPRVTEAKRFKAVMASSVGDVVVTTTGVHGRIVEVGTIDMPFLVEIADGVHVRIAQEGIKTILPGVKSMPRVETETDETDLGHEIS